MDIVSRQMYGSHLVWLNVCRMTWGYDRGTIMYLATCRFMTQRPSNGQH